MLEIGKDINSPDQQTSFTSKDKNGNVKDAKTQKRKQKAQKKCISSQGLACFLLQILNFYEISCIVMSIHVFNINELKVELGFTISFLMLSKTIKIIYLAKQKRYLLIVWVIICFDYLAIYIFIRDQRAQNKQIEQKDRQQRTQWIQCQEYQQQKIDLYIEKLEPAINQQQYELQQQQLTEQLQNKGKTKKNKSRQSSQYKMSQYSQAALQQTPQSQNPQKLAASTGDHLTQASPQFTALSNQIGEKNNPNFYKMNLDMYLGSPIIDYSNLNTHNLVTQQDEVDSNMFQKNLKIEQALPDSVCEKEIDGKKQIVKKSLENSIKSSSALKKFKLTSQQIKYIVNSKFRTIYVEDELKQEEENYFMNRKILLSSMRVIDGIILTAPSLYIVSYSIANNYDEADLIQCLYISYWSLVFCQAISICFFLNIQSLLFRKERKYLRMQLRCFIKNMTIVVSTIVSTSILWGISSRQWIPLLIYDLLCAIIIFHQVYSLLYHVYREHIQLDVKFKKGLFILAFFISILITCLLLFANLMLILNTDLINEAMLQFKKLLEQPNCQVTNAELLSIGNKQKIAYRFLVRQNLFYILNILLLFVINFFANQIYQQDYESDIILFHKILIFGFFPVCLLGILSLIYDYKLFNDSLNVSLNIHYNRLLERLNYLRKHLQNERVVYETIEQEHKQLDIQYKSIQAAIPANHTLISQCEAQETKLLEGFNQLSITDKLYNLQKQKISTILQQLNELCLQSSQLKHEIPKIKSLYEAKSEELNIKMLEIKQLESEFQQMIKDNIQ